MFGISMRDEFSFAAATSVGRSGIIKRWTSPEKPARLATLAARSAAGTRVQKVCFAMALFALAGQGLRAAASLPVLSLLSTNAGLQISVAGAPGAYAIQCASGLGGGPTNWTTLTNLILGGTAARCWDAFGAGQPQRFYRAVGVLDLFYDDFNSDAIGNAVPGWSKTGTDGSAGSSSIAQRAAGDNCLSILDTTTSAYWALTYTFSPALTNVPLTVEMDTLLNATNSGNMLVYFYDGNNALQLQLKPDGSASAYVLTNGTGGGSIAAFSGLSSSAGWTRTIPTIFSFCPCMVYVCPLR